MDAIPTLRLHRGQMSALARELGITRNAVRQWSRVPAERVPAVARITGIPRHMLRPDLWDDPSAWDPPDDAGGTRELGAWLRPLK